MEKRSGFTKKSAGKTVPNPKTGRGRSEEPVAIVRASKFSNVTSNELAKKVVHAVQTIRPQLAELRLLVIELRMRFEKLRTEKSSAPIHGCRTWLEFCDKQLHYSDRHVRRLIEGQNPGSSTYANKKGDERPKKAAQPSSKTGLVAAGNWSDERFDTCVMSTSTPDSSTYGNNMADNEAKKPDQTGSALSEDQNDERLVNACVSFVTRTLQRFKADASRSKRVAHKIAEEIVSAFCQDE